MTNKQSILNFNDVKTVSVAVPEWDCVVHVRTLNGAERSSLQAKFKDVEKTGRWSDLVTWTVVLCACEPNGERMFADADFEALSKKNAVAVQRLSEAARKLNGMDGEAVDDAKKD